MKKMIFFSLLISSVAAGGWFMFVDRQEHPLATDDPRHYFPHKYFYPIELTSDESEIPCLEAFIEDLSFLAKLDLGFDGVLSLPSEILNRLVNKSRCKPHIISGILGKQYRIETYKIQPLHFGGIIIGDFEVEEINLDFEKDLIVRGGASTKAMQPMARIGWRAFPKVNLFLELSHPKMACCDGLDTLKEHGYSVDEAVTTDLLLNRGFIEFKVDTPSGPVRCVLDTGSTLNLRHKTPDPFLEEPTFFHINFQGEPLPIDISIEGRLVGPICFYEAELPCGIEAIVGIDFLNEHCIFLDFVNEKIYFLPPQPHKAQSLTESKT